jgi:hypothetical protein
MHRGGRISPKKLQRRFCSGRRRFCPWVVALGNRGCAGRCRRRRARGEARRGVGGRASGGRVGALVAAWQQEEGAAARAGQGAEEAGRGAAVLQGRRTRGQGRAPGRPAGAWRTAAWGLLAGHAGRIGGDAGEGDGGTLLCGRGREQGVTRGCAMVALVVGGARARRGA